METRTLIDTVRRLAAAAEELADAAEDAAEATREAARIPGMRVTLTRYTRCSMRLRANAFSR